MTELENGIVITNESNNHAQFDRDNCYVILNMNLESNNISVQFFYCTGSSSSDGYNQKLRGSGKGKKLLLDSLIYIQQKHSQLVNVSIFPMPSLDPEKIEQIYKTEIDRYIASDEEMRTSFEEEVMYSSDYPFWAKRYDDLDRDAKQKIEQYKTEQEQKLFKYYKSLGFSGDGPVLYGNLSNIIKTISESNSDSTARGSRKNKKNKSRKDKKNKSRKDKKNKSRKDKKK
jgi:hypothetical protein